ncbi:MAG: inositol monophosphatase [Lachnospiraceae bacterium]|nr:inositol monophosphatase [Lachnospiraceae bacterium]
MKIQEVIALVKRTKDLVENQELAEHIKVKGPADYVTQVDIGIQNFLKEELSRLAPQIQFLGEETGLQELTGDSFWILDPIDGTTNLIHGYLHSTVSLGLCQQGEIVMGIVYDPFREEVFWAEKGKGSFLNDKPIQVSKSASLSKTIIGVGTTPYQRELAEENFKCFHRVFMRCQDIRRTGSAAMELAYTACGRQGGYFEACLQPWDYAAGLLLVQEAGGLVTDFFGRPTDPRKAGSVVATNGLLHKELLELLKREPS